MPPRTESAMSDAHLEKMAGRIDHIAKQLRFVAQAMRENEMASLSIPNHTSMVRAMKWLDGYSSAAWAALHEELADAGEYGPIDEILDAKKEK